MSADILTADQVACLEAIGRAPALRKNFYLSGGTPLAAFYLFHRYSEDLDFFSEQEVDPMEIRTFFKSQEKELGILSVDVQQSFNRNLFFLTLPGGVLKTEFTYFPFVRIERTVERKYGLEIDGPLDIAVNKLFTVYQRTKARDYIDLYFLCAKYGFSIPELARQVRIKFDTHMDPIQLGAQFLKAKSAEDEPRMIAQVDRAQWESFFIDAASKLAGDVFVE